MPTFTPPSTAYPNYSGDWLMDMLLQNHGISVYSTDGGVTWKESEYPYLGDLASIDPITSQTLGPGVEGTTYFLGGHIYTITQAVADSLTAAGYGANITP